MRRSAVLCFAAVALACTPELDPPLQLGPCEPGRVSHVEFFGYYSAGSHLEETAHYSTLHWGSVADVARASAAGMSAVVDVQSVFRIAWADRPSDAEIEVAWAAVAAELRPMRSAIAAIYPSDEPYWNGSRTGVSLDEVGRRLEHAARVIHSTPGFEGIPLAVIFANPTLDWMASGAARNPAGFSWVGFDHYGRPPAELEARAALFRSQLRADQRVVAVPDAVFLPGHPHDLRALEERIAFWLAWVERHPETVAVVPFIYWSSTSSDPAAQHIGARDLPPIVRERYAQIGACIARSVAARATSQTTVAP